MGGKSGRGQSAPYEAPNTLSSAQSLRIVDAVSEGVIYGFANGNDAPLKSIYFDDTPVQNADGSFNFKGVTAFFQRGEQNQSYIPGFDSSERTVAVSAGVKKATPIVRAVTDSLVNRLRVTVGVERNAQVHDNGDTRPATTVMLVELVNAQGVQHSQLVTFTEKSSGSYYHDVLFDRLPQAPFNIRVTRQSDDSNSDKLSNNTFFASYVEIIDVKLSFPHTALAAYSIDSDQFGNRVPRRNALIKGLLVNVPSNYDPEARAYGTPVWDGTFKKAWTNNPAWIFYDLCRQPRYSTLARRLKVADIDKWTLYEIGKYCDEPVDDGFGGKEPRFVCNAYITDRRPAGELLSDLASVFTGMAMWNGHQLSVMMDVDSDPVAVYSNANVVDGAFTYSGAALKSIHTAVHVQYIDKNDGYRTKTEYIADDAAIARYGLNIKQVTAFGCDSRGQAARFGAWVLETELRQQHTVSFTVGREGLKHLPFDVVQVMDNRYAGAEVSGRVVAVSGATVTLDRDVDNAVGAVLHYADADGFKSVKVTGQPSKNKLALAAAVALSENDVWALSAKVKPRLYRAIGIKENTDDGTYTVSALLHDPRKYADVDTAANFDRDITTLHTLEPVLLNADVKTENGALVLTWDNLTVSGQVLSYDIKIYRNNQLYRHTPDAATPEIRLENLPNGNYRAEIRGRNARGVLSEPLVKAWSINYTVTGLRTTPKTLSVDLTWVVPALDVSGLSSEVWYSKTNNIRTAKKLTTLAYPQNAYTLTGVSVTDTFYFWVRMVDKNGNAGEYTAAVEGRADNDPAPIVAQMQGAVTKSALSQDLLAQLNSDMGDAAASAVAAETQQRIQALQAEAAARTKAVQAEQAARAAAVKAAADKAAGDLLAKSSELGTRITAAENVNKAQAQQISTVTAAQGNTAAGLEAEKKARADGDRAEALARETLAGRIGAAEGAVNELRRTTVSAEGAESIVNRHLTARMAVKDTRNDNQPPTWYWNNYPKQTVQELKFASVMGVAAGSFVVVNTEVPWLNGSGGAIVQTATTNDGKTYRRLSDVAYTYQNGSYTYTKDVWGGWVEQETAAGSQAKADAVKAIADAAQRLATNTNADLIEFKRTQADKDLALAEKSEQLTARFDSLAAGGRNLLRDSGTQRQSADYLNRYRITDAPAIGEDVTVTLWGQLGDDRTDFGVYNSVGFNELAKLKKVSDGLYRATFKWKQHDANQNAGNDWANGTHLNVYTYPNTGTSENRIDRIKLERGNLGSDWTPAPEDAETRAAATAAALNEFKSTQVTKDEAVTNEIRDAKSRIGQNESSITELRNTRAAKTEVVSLARQGLQSEWQGFATRAKEQAVTAAQADATAKANAARQAAETAAQAKADAAKAQAVAAAGTDAKSKADAAKAQAIADAAAKDAVVKRQAADDAKAKADTAKAEAIAEARRLNNATNAEITKLQKTVADNDKARAEESRAVTARFDGLAVGGRNLLRDSNTSMQHSYLRRYEITQAPKVGDVVTVTVWGGLGATRNGNIGVYNSYGAGALFTLKKVKDGVYKGTGTWARHTGSLSIAQDTHLNLYAFPDNGATDDNRFDMVKLELGNIGTDWTPAPEDAAAKAAATEAALNEYKSAQATKDTATTKRIDSAVSRIGDAEAKLTATQQTVAGLDGKVQSLYTLKAETLSGGRKAVSALMMGADGQTADSQILLMADKVAFVQPNTKAITPMMTVTRDGMAINGNLVADGTILGKHLAANQTIQSPVINTGVINSVSFNSGSISIGNGAFTVDTAGNLYAKNGRFEGTVTAARIEGYLIEGISANAVNRTSWYSHPAINARVDYHFRKTDQRAARFICDPILLNPYKRSFKTSLVVYINGQMAKGYRTGSLSESDGVQNLPWHSYALEGACLLGCPSFDLPAGEVFIEVKLYSWKENPIPTDLTITKVEAPDSINGLFIYK
ncbi:DUF1983 domain-containing protein [Neisseria weixii]|uniref:TipJ family phage tail tip protein n=1 Tax=Neisseria weixii TaxID=1853276 RepID=UPI000F505F17|nr:phage tail protein [Neisseria weixii]RPD86263.1 DUF1983 domain-containing protein [Neisseria weixii]